MSPKYISLCLLLGIVLLATTSLADHDPSVSAHTWEHKPQKEHTIIVEDSHHGSHHGGHHDSHHDIVEDSHHGSHHDSHHDSGHFHHHPKHPPSKN
ncbi:hypothetical protein QL285_001542 [Trifolium repens]|nr:hypothetical protein QL285_001542 [Trifolium repens]